MRHLTLGRMNEFSCVGPACPYTCCAGGWNITIDKASYEYYQSVEGEYGAFLRDNIIERDGTASMKLYKGRCAQLTEDGLCRVYMELGKDKLCDTCKLYPRMQYIIGDICFHCFTISCPEVGRKTLLQKEPLGIYLSEDNLRTLKAPEKIKWPLFNLAFQTMLAGVNILQDRRYDIRQRQRLFLIMNSSIQNALDAKEFEKAKNLVRYFSSPEYYDSMLSQSQNGETRNIAGKVRMLRELSEPLLKIRSDSHITAVFLNAVRYLSRETDANHPFPEAMEYLDFWDSQDGQREQEHILVYALFRHYLLAENYEPYQRAVFAVMFNQIHRVFLAFNAACRGQPASVQDRVLFLAFMSRYFEHGGKNPLTERYFDDLPFLFQIIS